MDSLFILLVYFIILVVSLIVLMKIVEQNRIARLKLALMGTREGPLSEGSKVLIWEPGDWISTLAAFGSAFFILYLIFFFIDSTSYELDFLSYGLATGLLSFIFGLFYFYGIYYRRSARRVIIMENKGLTEVMIVQRSIGKTYYTNWQNIEKVVLNVGLGGGPSFTGSDNGIMIRTATRYIFIDRKLKNASLLFNEIIERFPRDFFSLDVYSYLASRSSKANQEYLFE